MKLNWSFRCKSDPVLLFKLEVYLEAKPLNKYYAYATRVFDLEVGIGYWVAYLWCNR